MFFRVLITMLVTGGCLEFYRVKVEGLNSFMNFVLKFNLFFMGRRWGGGRALFFKKRGKDNCLVYFCGKGLAVLSEWR